jgi:hypothetical protein
VGFLRGPGGITVAVANFTNSEPFSVTYTGVALFANNRLSNYNLDNFTTPTAIQPVSGIPDTFVLGAAGSPTASATYSFGSISTIGYELALGTVAPTNDLGNMFQEASANAVPEASSLVIMALAGFTFASVSVLTSKVSQRRSKGD